MKLSKNWLAVILASLVFAMAGLLPQHAQAASTTKTASKSKAKARAKIQVAKAAQPARARAVASVDRRKVKGRVGVKRTLVSTARGSRSIKSQRGRLAVVSSPAVPELTPMEINASALPKRASAHMVAASGASGASFGKLYGLHRINDPLDLKSSVALVVDQETNEVLFAKNSEAVLPIASLTKLMTATVVVESRLPMDDVVTITSEDVDTEKNSSSRLSVGATLTRGELLHLALMASENRAAHALGRTYPGGLSAFVSAMNAKARALGMQDTHYVDPTGLNSKNQSSAKDLAVLVRVAYQQPLIRELSTSKEYTARVGSRQIQFHNTNSLVRNPAWDIGLQKTGYIVEAGRCLVMQARMAGRRFIMVFLDSTGKYSRQADAERVRRWIEVGAKRNAISGVSVSKFST